VWCWRGSAVNFLSKAVSGLARWARWPTAVIGVTVAAFGTSSPELLVAIHAALDGVPADLAG
jgi:cation:H+ antiporter